MARSKSKVCVLNQGFNRILAILLMAGLIFALQCSLALAADGSGPGKLPAKFFHKVYSEINTYHVNPPVPKQLFYWTVSIVQKTDPLIQTRESERLLVYYNHRPLLAYRLPDENDVSGWANISQDFVERAYGLSSKLQQQDLQELGQKIAATIVQNLDKYSRISFSTQNQNPVSLAERNDISPASIGVTVRSENGVARVIKIHESSPAAEQLKLNDTLLAADGVDVSGWKASEIIKLLRGQPDSPVQLLILRNGQQLRLSITRQILEAQNVQYQQQDGILMIRITRFTGGTANKVANILHSKQNEFSNNSLLGVVLDLRGNRGGVLNEATAIADLFLDSGNLVSMRGRHPDSNFDFKVQAGQNKVHAPLAILIDGFTASSAEVLAVSLQHNNRAIVIGSNSYGKGAVQRASYVKGLGQVAITWSEILVPGKHPYALSNVGVKPNICLANQLEPDPDKQPPEPGKEFIWLRRAPQITWNSRTCPKEPRLDRKEDISIAAQVVANPDLYNKILKNNENPA